MNGELTKQITVQIADEALAALAPIAAKYGFNVDKNGGTYGLNDLVLKFRFSPAGDAEKAAWDRSCSLFGLLPSDYGAKIVVKGGLALTAVGFQMTRGRMPVVARDAAGKTYYVQTVLVKNSRKPA